MVRHACLRLRKNPIGSRECGLQWSAWQARAVIEAHRKLAQGEAEITEDSARLHWLHSPGSNNVDGYEWGIYRVKWTNGKAAEVWQTNADFSDLDAARRASPRLALPGNEELLEIADGLLRGDGYVKRAVDALRALASPHLVQPRGEREDEAEFTGTDLSRRTDAVALALASLASPQAAPVEPPDLATALRACAEYLECIPETAAGGDDAAAKLAQFARSALAAN